MKKIIIALLSALALTFVCAELYAKPKTETVTYVVSIHCQNCVDKLTDNLSFLKGVKDFKISLKDKTVVIKYDPAKIQKSQFEDIMTKLGYTFREL
ncbi:MAG: heavy-metal-associated domain-containing protein [Bacteroidales bacterium]|nr:heavy-metal-associated domain-containing protein [Bacteroidales bacterium]